MKKYIKFTNFIVALLIIIGFSCINTEKVNATEKVTSNEKVNSEATKNGLIHNEGNVYFYENNTLVKGWKKIDGKWYFFDKENGKMKTSWFKEGDSWYYLKPDGSMDIGWRKLDNKWYFLDKESGKMKTGWFKEGDSWYYLKPDGSMDIGWRKLDNKWYFLDKESGKMKTGWFKEGDSWYYLKPDGSMDTGWRQLDNKWYFLDKENGKMKTGWLEDGDSWYYLNPKNGEMMTNTTIDGYYLSKSGKYENKGEEVVNYAKQFLGTKYVYGGTTPNGFDCSGFTQYVYKHALGINISRTTYTQINEGKSVSRSNLKVGDLVFPSSHHVGIYIGNGKIIHAPQTGDVVKISNIWSFYAARRITN
ncbi:MAG: NlpC/P60 family protein [Clostridium sp.]|uniref:NlpC/P60 family protein n=1 Tax=Clostridium sp. TaxID=1506 RepID=UPI002FC64C32